MYGKQSLPILGFLLIVFVVGMLGNPSSANAQTVHALLIIMDNDKDDIGKDNTTFNKAVKQNLQNVMGMLQPLDIRPEIWQASIRLFQPTDIIHQVQNLNVQKEDTVFVYYSGHGQITDNVHYLTLEKGSRSSFLPRIDLAEVVSEKNCQLKMLITDTCSNVVPVSPSEASPGQKATPDPILPDAAVMTDLFFEHEGFLDITATEPRHYGLGDLRGGYFTKALIISSNTQANVDGNDFISWHEVFELTKKETQKLFGQRTVSLILQRELNTIGQMTQTPVQYSLPTRIIDETPPDQPSTTESQTTAMLDITSIPSGATVYIDGTQVGTTPLYSHEIDTRTYGEKQVKISLALEGYKERETHIILKGGKNKPWNVELEKMPTQPDPPIITVADTSDMMLIPAGPFRMGSDKISENGAKRIHTVYLDAFWIDTHEVTVGEYKQFLLDSEYQVSLHPELSKHSPTDDHPIVGVSWQDAMAYARWAGKRLPTEAEWEKAARGGLLSEDYPWGNDDIDSSKANYGNIQEHTTRVGSYPANEYGLYDMAGNAAEWCMDPFDVNFYTNSPDENPFAGHRSLEATINDYKSVTGLRVVRGGSWRQAKSGSFRVSARGKNDATKRYTNIGFRCVKEAPRSGGRTTQFGAIIEEDTSDMVLIPNQGPFRMGTEKIPGNETKPEHPVSLDAFWIDTHEVTVGEYKQFLLDSEYQVSLHPELSKHSPTDDHPIVGVSWQDAMAYARWAGKRLPTEAEWEKAARGGLLSEDYPWGNDDIDSSKANYGNIQEHTTRVGSYPANEYGLYDMAGNAAEWCLDLWDSNFYANSPAENPFSGHWSLEATVNNYESVTGFRVVRGGAWDQISTAEFLVGARFKYDAMRRPTNVGFRCAKDAP